MNYKCSVQNDLVDHLIFSIIMKKWICKLIGVYNTVIYCNCSLIMFNHPKFGLRASCADFEGDSGIILAGFTTRWLFMTFVNRYLGSPALPWSGSQKSRIASQTWPLEGFAYSFLCQHAFLGLGTCHFMAKKICFSYPKMVSYGRTAINTPLSTNP